MSKRSAITAVLFLAVLLAAAYFRSTPLLCALGHWLIVDETTPQAADAVVVLNSGVEYYPRLIEAAALYTGGWAGYVLINGNRNPVNPVNPVIKSPPPL